METKLSQLKLLAANGDYRGALRIAAKFPRLGKDATAIKRAHESYGNQGFYQQLGYDIEQLRSDGIAAIKAKYKLN
jgi:hypothetical protein